jgi:uncharacterized membrane protein
MMWNGDGSWGWWGPGLLLLIICMVMMVRMMSQGTHRSHMDEQRWPRPDGAERILADRLACGEIGIDEYERRMAVLQRASQSDRT